MRERSASKLVIGKKWERQEVPAFEGLICAAGDFYEIQDDQLIKASGTFKVTDWLNVAVLAQKELYGGEYIVRCGEAAEHGSIGVVVLESSLDGELVWSFASDKTNPFDQIEVKGSYVLVLSTSGAVLLFQAPLEHVKLFLP